MSRPRFIHIEFGPGVPQAEYEAFVEVTEDLAEATMAAQPSDCDNEIWVSGGGAIQADDDPQPEQPHGPGAFCDSCGHFAARHGIDGCTGVSGPCACPAMLWCGTRWPRPWLPAPEGLRRE